MVYLKNKMYFFSRVIGVILLVLSLIILNISFLESLTFISPDHHITANLFITIVFFLKLAVVIFCVILIIYPRFFSVLKLMLKSLKQAYYKNIDAPPLYLVCLLFLVALLYLSLIFIGQTLMIFPL